MKGKEWMIFPGMCFTMNTDPSGPSNLHLCHWKYAPYVFTSSRFSVLGACDLQFGKERYNRMNGILYSKNIQKKKKSKKLLCSKACIKKKKKNTYLLILRKQWCELDHTLVLWIKFLLALVNVAWVPDTN